MAVKAKNFWIFVSFTSDRLSYFVKRLRPVGCSTVCSSQLQLCGASQKKRKSQNKKAIKAKKNLWNHKSGNQNENPLKKNPFEEKKNRLKTWFSRGDQIGLCFGFEKKIKNKDQKRKKHIKMKKKILSDKNWWTLQILTLFLVFFLEFSGPNPSRKFRSSIVGASPSTG